MIGTFSPVCALSNAKVAVKPIPARTSKMIMFRPDENSDPCLLFAYEFFFVLMLIFGYFFLRLLLFYLLYFRNK